MAFKKLQIQNKDSNIYNGLFDKETEIIINVEISSNKKLSFDLKKIISNQNKIDFLSASELIQICQSSGIQGEFFKNGNYHLKEVVSKDPIINTCYLYKAYANNSNYIVCLAFDEVQPMVYSARIIDIYEIY